MDIRARVLSTIQSRVDDAAVTVEDQTPLIGDGSILDSLKLVDVCLALEDLASELDFEFDWTSEAAMSRSRSMFRTAGSLADAFVKQMEGHE